MCAEALASAEYKAWMSSFAANTQHIVVNAQLNSQRIVFGDAGAYLMLLLLLLLLIFLLFF